MKEKYKNTWYIFLIAILLTACEKEITVDLPISTPQYVVEASINQIFPSLNYVFISKSVDYFNPDLTMRGVSGATVYITEGTITGTDTLFTGTKTLLKDLSSTPGFDTLFKGLSGIYFNGNLLGKVNTAYLLEILLPDGKVIKGKTYIPKVVQIDTVTYEIRNQSYNHKGKRDAFITLYYTDPPEQNNYRMAIYTSSDSLMLGWGTSDRLRTFDDQFLNGEPRILNFNNSYSEGDTVNIYFNSIGRKEFLFWQSFSAAANNGGPFATPVQVKSNITGAIGSFTGFGCSYRQVILK